MRESGANFEIGPTITEPIACFASGDVDRVVVDAVDPGEGFNQVDGVTFVASKLRPDGMSIDADSDHRIYQILRIYKMSVQIL